MQQIVRDVCADFGAELGEFNGQANHVHLLVNFPPTVAISRLVNSLKGVSSRRLRAEFPDLRPPLAGQEAVVRVILRRVSRCPDLRPAPAHLAAGPSRLTSSRPAAFTTGLKAGALAAISVA
jgi:Transposase IS200 like